MKNMTNIIVACGGSGAKIAVKIAELMGQDPKWRHEMDENIYFMLVDTDKGDLNEYASKLKSNDIAPNLFVETCQTSMGYLSASAIIDDLIRTQPSEAGLARFAEHWWCGNDAAKARNELVPFLVGEVKDLTAGAAQVPMISLLAAWASMKDSPKNPISIERAMVSLCNQIAKVKPSINSQGENPLSKFNIYFVGSVAGGTGRGALIPVAFKMKEVFYERFKQIPVISAYLMDQSCFSNSRDPSHKMPQMINALTGWSEISSWLNSYAAVVKDPTSKRRLYPYSLPGAGGLHDYRSDALRSHLGSAYKRGESGAELLRVGIPFDAVGFIGGRSASGFEVSDPNNIYQMISTAMYVRLSQSEVDSKISNEGRVLFSVGSSVSEVPFEEIRRYLKKQATSDAVTAFMSEPREEVTKNHVQTILGSLGLDNPLEDFLNLSTDQENSKGPMQFFAKACMSPGGMIDERLAGLATALTEQDPGSVDDIIATTLSLQALDDPSFIEAVTAGYVRAVCADDLKNNPGQAVNSIQDILMRTKRQLCKVMEETDSVAAVARAASGAYLRIRNVIDKELSSKEVEAWYAKARLSPPDVASLHDRARRREGFMGVSGKHYTEQEIAEVMAEAKRQLAGLMMSALAKGLSAAKLNEKTGEGLMTAQLLQLEDVAHRAKFLLKCATAARSRLNINDAGLEDERSKLFAPKDLASALDDDSGINIRRRIRPIFPSSSELFLSLGRAGDFAREVIIGVDARGQEIPSPGKRDEAIDREGWVDQLQGGFTMAEYKGVFGSGEKGKRDVMQKFRLTNVLRDLAVEWRKVLQASWDSGNKDQFHFLKQRFSKFYGIEPEENGGVITISGGQSFRSVAGEDSLLLGLACAQARTCRPFWQTKNNEEKRPHLIVQIPVSIEAASKNRWAELIKEQSNMPQDGLHQIDLIANETVGSDKEHNPYILAVYTSSSASSLDEIETLRAWENDPSLRDCLRVAEDLEEKVKMPFNPEMETAWISPQPYRGSGFTDPCYIYNSELRRSRWRPWVSEEEAKAQERMGAGGKQALVTLYACLGPKWLLEAALGDEDAAQVLEQTGIPQGPIFERGEKKLFKLGRFPFTVGKRGRVDENSIGIKIREGNSVAQSICTLPDVLAGRREAKSSKGEEAGHQIALGKAVEQEFEHFFGEIAAKHGFDRENSRKAHLKLLLALRQHCRDARRAEKTGSDEGDGLFWDQLDQALTQDIDDLES